MKEGVSGNENDLQKQVVLSVPQGPKSYICVELQILQKYDADAENS